MYKTGSVLGVKQFLQDDYWEEDIICQEEGSIIAKFSYEQFQEMRNSQPPSAMKLYNRIIRNRCFEILYEKKNDPEVFATKIEKQMDHLKDQDLFIDLRLGSYKDIINLFEANREKQVVANLRSDTANEKRSRFEL